MPQASIQKVRCLHSIAMSKPVIALAGPIRYVQTYCTYISTSYRRPCLVPRLPRRASIHTQRRPCSCYLHLWCKDCPCDTRMRSRVTMCCVGTSKLQGRGAESLRCMLLFMRCDAARQPESGLDQYEHQSSSRHKYVWYFLQRCQSIVCWRVRARIYIDIGLLQHHIFPSEHIKPANYKLPRFHNFSMKQTQQCWS